MRRGDLRRVSYHCRAAVWRDASRFERARVRRRLPTRSARVRRAHLGERARLGAPALAARRELQQHRVPARGSLGLARASGPRARPPRIRRSCSRSCSSGRRCATWRARSRGRACGTEIWTRLTPLSPERTDIEVEFLLPGIPPARREALGRAYVRLYTLLWDQDAAMMTRREARARRARSQRAGGARFARARAARRAAPAPAADASGSEAASCAWSSSRGSCSHTRRECPHRLGPLADAPIVDGCVRCPWHGYRFDVRSGRSADGRPFQLAAAPRVRIDPESSQVELRFEP